MNALPNRSGLISACSVRPQTLEDLVAELWSETLPLVPLDQIHSSAFIEITDPIPQIQPQVDASFTRVPNILLTVRSADCLPILFTHPSGWVGGIHAGRVGTELGITHRVFEHFVQHLNLKDGFEIWFGPCICEACYQIDPLLDIHYNLVKQNLSQLSALLDLSQSTVIQSGYCTSCRNDLFYSYRKEKTTLRMYSVIGMRA